MVNAQVHDTANIDEGARIGDESLIGPWSHICAGARIGKNCSIGQNVYIADKVIIGDNVKIENNVSIYDEVVIEDEVFIGPSVVFTNVAYPRAMIDRCEEPVPIRVCRGATLGANSTIICGVQVGKFGFVGAGAVLTGHVLDYALVVGVPAVQTAWMSEYGTRLDMPLFGNAQAVCPDTGTCYEMTEGEVKRVDI